MSLDDHSQRLNRLLAEDFTSALEREASTLEKRIGSLDDPFVLFGAGNLGRKVLERLDRHGKRPLAFIDNNSELWGTQVAGVPVLSPSELAHQHDVSRIGVITTIWFGEASDRMSDRIAPLRALGYSKIALFAHLAWKFPEDFLPHYCLDRPSRVLRAAKEIRTAFELLGDDESRKLFVDHIEWRLHMDYDVLPFSSKLEIYFNEYFVNVSPEEVLYDIGAYNGDSTESFLKTRRGREFNKIHCFEPAPENYIALQACIENLADHRDKIFSHQLALGCDEGHISVETSNGPASRVGIGSLNVPITTIDRFSINYGSPTFIKIDIEGFEPQCLLGAEQTIRETVPVIAVSVYHLQSHIWEIITQIHSYFSEYKFSLCPHVADGWDLVLYCVPPSRIPMQ